MELFKRAWREERATALANRLALILQNFPLLIC